MQVNPPNGVCVSGSSGMEWEGILCIESKMKNQMEFIQLDVRLAVQSCCFLCCINRYSVPAEANDISLVGLYCTLVFGALVGALLSVNVRCQMSDVKCQCFCFFWFLDRTAG